MGSGMGGIRAHQQPTAKPSWVLLSSSCPLLGVERVRWWSMIPAAEIRVTEGYYEDMRCEDLKNPEIEIDEGTRKILEGHCRTRGKEIEVLKIIVVKDREGNVKRVWTIEAYYGPFGVLVFIDNP
jgi:hypothetical protein